VLEVLEPEPEEPEEPGTMLIVGELGAAGAGLLIVVDEVEGTGFEIIVSVPRLFAKNATAPTTSNTTTMPMIKAELPVARASGSYAMGFVLSAMCENSRSRAASHMRKRALTSNNTSSNRLARS
jgi:hypothetical protein